MKLLGLSCGQKMGNCEILLKEALIGAEELGAEVEFMHGEVSMFVKPAPGVKAILSFSSLRKNVIRPSRDEVKSAPRLNSYVSIV